MDSAPARQSIVWESVAEQAIADLQKRNHELAVINRVVSAVGSSLDLKKSLQIIARELAQAISVRQVGIAVLNEARTALTVVAEYMQSDTMPSALGAVIPLANNPATQQVIATRQPLVITDPQTNPMTASAHDVLRYRRTETLMLLPMVVGEDVLGTVGVDTLEPGRQLSDDQMRLARTIVFQAAAAVQNVRLFEQVQQRADELEDLTALRKQTMEALAEALATSEEQSRRLAALNALSAELNRTPELEAIYELVVARVAQLVPSDRVTLGLLDKSGTTIEIVALFGEAGDVPMGTPQPIANTVTEQIVQHQAIVTLHNDSVASDHSINSSMIVPLITGRGVIGTLNVSSRKLHAYDSQDEAFMMQLASLLSAVIEMQRLFRQSRLLLAETQAQAERLQKLDQLKSEFLASMSHELRTPLNAIIGFSDVLLEGLDGELTPQMTEDVTFIRDSGRHLRELIGNILDMSKIEAGMMALRCEQVNVPALIEQLLGSARVLAEQKGLCLSAHVAPEVTTVYADPTRLRQILLNLIGNAIKFTERGTVRLIALEDGNDLRLEVQDSGIGLHHDDLSIIFEQFRQVDGSMTRSSGGTGLGLPISKKLVELHGGQMGVESRPGIGSTFWFTIPIQ